MISLFKNDEIFLLPSSESIVNKIKGGNKKKIFILYQAPEGDNELLAYLKKILAAVKVDLEADSLYLNLQDQSLDFSSLNKQLNCQTILIFGPLAARCGINLQLPLYHPTPIQDLQLLYCNDLQAIFDEKNQAKRPKASALWKSLQLLFTEQ